MSYRLAVTAALCLAASPVLAATQPLTCGGIPADATAASLGKTYGAANLATESVAGAEGASVKTTVIFPKDKSKRLIVFWKDEAARSGIDSLIVRRDDRANPTTWEVAGLTLASTLADIEKLKRQELQALGVWLGLRRFRQQLGGRQAGETGGRLPTGRAVRAGKGCRSGSRGQGVRRRPV